jgi:hypothetical protein
MLLPSERTARRCQSRARLLEQVAKRAADRGDAELVARIEFRARLARHHAARLSDPHLR